MYSGVISRETVISRRPRENTGLDLCAQSEKTQNILLEVK